MMRVCLVVLMLLSCVSAQAQGEPAQEGKNEASAHFKQGVELFREGAYRAALVELQRANEIAPDFRVLFNIGQTLLALNEYVEAIKAFESYLVQGGSQVEASRREEVERDLAGLRKRVATLAITVNEGGADVFVDNELIGKSPLGGTVPVSVGRHRVLAQTAAGGTASQVVDVAGGDLTEINLVLSAPKVEVVTRAAEPAPVAQEPSMSKRKKWAIGLVSGAGVLAIGTTVAAIVAAGAKSDYDSGLEDLPGSASKLKSDRDSATTWSHVTDGLGATAIVLGIAGVTLFALGDGESSEEEPDDSLAVQVRLTPTGLMAKGQF